MTMTPPIAIELIDKNRQRAVHRGTTYPAPFIVRRLEGFSGQVLLQMAAKQGRHRQGIFGPILAVLPDQERVDYPIFLPEWLETDRTTRMVVLGAAKVADPKGNIRYLTKAADARVTMILEGALLTIRHTNASPRLRSGDSCGLDFEVSRSEKLAGPITVSLTVPAELEALVESTSVSLTSDQRTGTLRVVAKNVSHEELRGRWTLQLRATAMQDGRWPVRAQTDVEMDIESGKRDPTSGHYRRPINVISSSHPHLR